MDVKELTENEYDKVLELLSLAVKIKNTPNLKIFKERVFFFIV